MIMNVDYAKQNRQLVVFKMLANANRLKILRAIIASKDGELNVSEIAKLLNLPLPKVSDHLRLMRVNKILKSRQAGALMFYALKEPAVAKFLADKL